MLSIIYLQDRVCPLAAASVHRDIKDLVLLVHLFVYLSLSRARAYARVEKSFAVKKRSLRLILFRQMPVVVFSSIVNSMLPRFQGVFSDHHHRLSQSGLL